MKIEMLGHASMVVRTTDLTILMDPVLWDPHQEGLFNVYPGREVLNHSLPQISIIIISHRHLDHFDIRSLAYLPKTVPVFIPQDSMLEGYLRRLGYSKIKLLNDFSEVRIGKTRLLTTRSENRVPEYGIVFSDESGVLWNQVDTVVSAPTVQKVHSLFPDIHLMIASWQPMMESNFQTNKTLSFPYGRYGQILYNIGLASPRALIPGANAFCYTGSSRWLNHIVFPVSRERFMADVVATLPSLEGKTFPADPGDAIEFRGGEFNFTPAGCRFVKKLGGDLRELSFSPVTADARMIDENIHAVPENDLDSSVTRTVEQDLPELFLRRHELFSEHRRWRVLYELTVVFPDKTRVWNIDFAPATPVLSREPAPAANVVSYVTASSLYGMATRTSGWDYAYLGGHYRTFNRLYLPTPNGVLRPEEGSIVEPLEVLFPYQEIFTAVLDREVENWYASAVKAAV